MYNFMGLFCVVLELRSFEDEKMRKMRIYVKTGIFSSSNGRNSRTTHNNPIKLYIFEISMKLVDI